MEILNKILESTEKTLKVQSEHNKMIKILTLEIKYLHEAIGIIGADLDLSSNAKIDLYSLTTKHEAQVSELKNKL